MTSRLLLRQQIAKICTRGLYTVMLIFIGGDALAQTHKSNAFYEIVVVESLPEGMNLSMSLKDITEAKDSSRVGETKKNIYDFLNKSLSPILNEYAAQENKSLVDLAAKLPIADLLKGLVNVNKGITSPSEVTPADYMIVILPKLPESESISISSASASVLYSSNKASVIDVSSSKSFDVTRNYQELINGKLKSSIKYMYTRHFVKLKQKEPFFVGALFNVHIEGEKTEITTQLVGSLPTDVTEVFENQNDQVHLKHAHSPKTPTQQSIDVYGDFPGVVVEFAHTPLQKNLMNLNVQFGSLGLIEGKTWKVKNTLQKIEDTLIDKHIGVGLDFTTKFNIPHLTGSLQVPIISAGMSFTEKAAAKATSAAAALYTVKINIHEVYMNVNKVEIERIRVNLNLEPIVDEEKIKQSIEAMRYSPYAPMYIPGMGAPRLPTIEMESVSGQFTEEGNKALAPVREKLELVLGKSPEQLLNDPKIQAEILKFVLNYMQSKQIKTGGVK